MGSDKYRTIVKNILMHCLSKIGKKEEKSVYIGDEDEKIRKETSYKKRKHYIENKNNFPKKTNNGKAERNKLLAF